MHRIKILITHMEGDSQIYIFYAEDILGIRSR